MASGEVGAQRLRRSARAARPRRHRGAGRRDHRAQRSGDPGHASASSRPARTAPVAELDLADGSRDRHRLRHHGRPGARRDPRRLRRARRAPAPTASTSSRTTPTPTPPSRCARCSTPSCPTTTAAWRRSRSRRLSVRSSTPCRPQPCTARHVVGMFLPNALLKALAQIKPEQAMAEGSGRGVDHAGVSGTTTTAGRSSRRCSPTPAASEPALDKPGLSACSYPTGVAAVPVEVVEASAPIRFHRKSLRSGSGGDGRQIGGLGQTVEFTVDTTRPWQLNAVTSRLAVPAAGHLRRRPGCGRFVHRQRRSRCARSSGSPCNRATGSASSFRAGAATAPDGEAGQQ